jgi:hypothetical protein
MEKSDVVFVLLQAPISQLQNPNNPITQHINESQVKSILDLQFFQGHPQAGMHQTLFVGLLYERALPEEQQPREPKKESRKGPAFQKRPKPLPLR